MTILPISPGTPPPAPVAAEATRPTPGKPRSDGDLDAFRRELDGRVHPSRLTFSRHALKRLDMRGIAFTPQGLERIEGAIDRAAAKGSRDALIVAGGLSLVVNIPNRTVVTVMSQDTMRESVVTNIDSAVFA